MFVKTFNNPELLSVIKTSYSINKSFSSNNFLFSRSCKSFSCYCERFCCRCESFSCCRFFNITTILQFPAYYHAFLSDCERFSCYCKSFSCYCERFSCHCKSFSCCCGNFRPLSRHNLLTCVCRTVFLELSVISPTFCKPIWSLSFKGSNLFFAPNKLSKWLTLLTRRN